MDISDTLAPDSAQLDAVDLLGGPRVFTIAEVTRGSTEQPVKIKLAEFDRPWMPGKSMRRVLASCWGTEASVWVGRRVELLCDPNVRFGGAAVGGVRIKSLSNIDKRQGVPLLVSRGKSAVYVVEPLREQAPKPQQQQPRQQPEPAQDPQQAWDSLAPPPSEKQLAMMFALLANAGLTERGDALGYVGSIIGHSIESRSELNRDEVSAVIDALNATEGDPR